MGLERFRNGKWGAVYLWVGLVFGILKDKRLNYEIHTSLAYSLGKKYFKKHFRKEFCLLCKAILLFWKKIVTHI